MYHRPNVKQRTIKLLEDNIGADDLGFGYDFLYTTKRLNLFK